MCNSQHGMKNMENTGDKELVIFSKETQEIIGRTELITIEQFGSREWWVNGASATRVIDAEF